jgi:hypothetical protein
LASLTGALLASTVALFIVTLLELRHNRHTAKMELRAYMGMMTLGTRPIAANGDVSFFFVNYGKTPAHRVSMWCCIIPATSHNHIFKYSEADIVARNQITHPNQQFGQIIGNVGTIPENRDCFVHGCIEYLDAFGHKWRFCYAYTP